MNLLDLLEDDLAKGRVKIPKKRGDNREDFARWIATNVLWLIEEQGGILKRYEFSLIGAKVLEVTGKKFSENSYTHHPLFEEKRVKRQKLSQIIKRDLIKNLTSIIKPDNVANSHIWYLDKEKAIEYLSKKVLVGNIRRKGQYIARLREPYSQIDKFNFTGRTRF